MVREVKPEDLNELLKLYLYLHEKSLPEMSEHLKSTWNTMIEDENHHIIVNEIEGKIISSCVCVIIPNLTRNIRPYAFVENVVTHEAYRGKGYATECLNYAKEIARRTNCYKIMLLTGSKEETTLKFYENAGYNSSDKTAFIQWIKKSLPQPDKRCEKGKGGSNTEKSNLNADIEAVITSYNQGSMIQEAVQSLCSQTRLPRKIIIIDDGSTDEDSLRVLKDMEKKSDFPIPVLVHYQKNGGVSAARNAGIKNTQSSMVLVLDGDDKLEPDYIESVGKLLHDNPSMVAASSWMHTFGVLDALVCPAGGNIVPFLSNNCCPATHILRRENFEQCGGYDESMRSGFEDWDFFLSMLETLPEACIGIVEKPLINYCTAPASSNIKSMNKRLELMRYIIEKHIVSYRNHVADVILEIEAISNSRLYGWENEMIHSIANNQKISEAANDFVRKPSYGDGGMASAVRIVSTYK